MERSGGDFCDLTLWTPDIIRSPLKPLQQHSLSKAVDKSSFAALMGKSSLFNKARLLCVRGAGVLVPGLLLYRRRR